MRGRKPKLTWQAQQQIVQYLRTGASLEAAAGAVGIHRTTLFRWLQKGEQATRGRYHEFVVAVTQAQSEYEIRCQVTITKAAQKDWKPAAWGLERRFPERYGRQYSAGIRAGFEQVLDHLASTLDESQYAAVLRSLEGSPPPEEPPQDRRDVREVLLERLRKAAEQKKQEADEPKPTDPTDNE